MGNLPLSPAESLILERLGGRRWTVKRYRRPGTVRAARQAWGESVKQSASPRRLAG